MDSTLPLEEAQARLPELLEHLAPGDEIVLTRKGQPVAKLVGSRPARKRRQPSNCKGMLTIISDEDEHLEHFKNHVPRT
jgi:prevent-host-death family protein